MALEIPQDYASVIHSIRLTGDPEPMAVTYGVSIDGTAPPADPGALASALGTLFGTHMKPRFPNSLEFVSTEVVWQDVAPPTEPVIGSSTSGAGPGTAGAVTLIPQNSAFLVHKRTSWGGHRGRGRFYFPGVAEGDVDNVGNVLTATMTAWNTSLAAWLSAITAHANLAGMVLLHGPSTAAVPTPIPVPYFINTLVMDPVIATQRRRLRR